MKVVGKIALAATLAGLCGLIAYSINHPSALLGSEAVERPEDVLFSESNEGEKEQKQFETAYQGVRRRDNVVEPLVASVVESEEADEKSLLDEKSMKEDKNEGFFEGIKRKLWYYPAPPPYYPPPSPPRPPPQYYPPPPRPSPPKYYPPPPPRPPPPKYYPPPPPRPAPPKYYPPPPPRPAPPKYYPPPPPYYPPPPPPPRYYTPPPPPHW